MLHREQPVRLEEPVIHQLHLLAQALRLLVERLLMLVVIKAGFDRAAALACWKACL